MKYVNDKASDIQIAYIGGGSRGWAWTFMTDLALEPALGGTIRLYDIDHAASKNNEIIGNKVSQQTEAVGKWEYKSIDTLAEALDGADFVVISTLTNTFDAMDVDVHMPERLGIYQSVGDTAGPGGMIRAMRTIPVYVEFAKAIRKYCPDAWVINYINPTAVHGIGLRRYAPKLKSFALCDGLHMPHVKRNYALRAGIIGSREEYSDEVAQKFDFRVAGVNHFTWLIKAEYDGRDVVPEIAAHLKREAARETDGGDRGAKAVYNNKIGYELYKIFGYIPTCVAHTKEYVRFWQGIGKTKEEIPPLYIWETEERYKRHDEMWKQVDGFINGKLPISDYMKTFASDHATDIIESMVGRLNKSFYVNTFNNGAVTNMNDDAFLELCCDISMEGIKPYPVGEMPRGIRGMQELVLDTHELTAEAIAECSLEKIRRAMLTDPIVSSIGDADNIVKGLLELERDALPSCWFE